MARNVVWDGDDRVYRDAQTGAPVKPREMRMAMDQAIDVSAGRVEALGRQLQQGQIGLIEWELAMRREVKNVLLYSVAVHAGGVRHMTPRQLGMVGAATREQYRYLNRFAREIESGLPLDGRFLQRVRMYAAAGRQLYHRIEREVMEARGMTHERNLLGVADHCDGCVEETSRGWVAIGTLVPIGARTCLSNCRCRIVYRRPGG